MIDKNLEIAAKYNIQIKNLLIYQAAFEKLVELEQNGISTSWIGNTLPDEQEWVRYLQYEIENDLNILKTNEMGCAPYNHWSCGRIDCGNY